MPRLSTVRLIKRLVKEVNEGSTFDAIISSTSDKDVFKSFVEDKKGMLLLANTANTAVFTAMTKSSTAMGYIVNNQAALSYFTDNPILNNLLYDGVADVGIVTNYNIVKYRKDNDITGLKSIATFQDIVNNSTVMSAITANARGLINISTSAVALNKFLASSSSDLLYSATSNVGDILNKLLINNGGAGNAVLAGLATFQDVINNAIAFSALINNKTTISTLVENTVAVNKITSNLQWMNSATSATSNVGYMLNKINVANGKTSDDILAAKATAALVVDDLTAFTAIYATKAIINSILNSSTLMNVLKENKSILKNVIWNSESLLSDIKNNTIAKNSLANSTLALTISNIYKSKTQSVSVKTGFSILLQVSQVVDTVDLSSYNYSGDSNWTAVTKVSVRDQVYEPGTAAYYNLATLTWADDGYLWRGDTRLWDENRMEGNNYKQIFQVHQVEFKDKSETGRMPISLMGRSINGVDIGSNTSVYCTYVSGSPTATDCYQSYYGLKVDAAGYTWISTGILTVKLLNLA
jgi:hypothetical protein